MKRTPFSILGLILTSFILLTFINSCEVEHFYDAEITVVNAMGEPLPGYTVTPVVEVDTFTILDQSISEPMITNEIGKVFFEFDNVAILKIEACLICDMSETDPYGEALLVIEEDKTVPITVVVYN